MNPPNKGNKRRNQSYQHSNKGDANTKNSMPTPENVNQKRGSVGLINPTNPSKISHSDAKTSQIDDDMLNKILNDSVFTDFNDAQLAQMEKELIASARSNSADSLDDGLQNLLLAVSNEKKNILPQKKIIKKRKVMKERSTERNNVTVQFKDAKAPSRGSQINPSRSRERDQSSIAPYYQAPELHGATKVIES